MLQFNKKGNCDEISTKLKRFFFFTPYHFINHKEITHHVLLIIKTNIIPYASIQDEEDILVLV